SFARRNSRTSRSRSPTRCAPAVVTPAASSESISTSLTQVRSASGCIPSRSAIRPIAPVFVTGSRRATRARRVARLFSSSLYFLGAAMTLILHRFESLHQARGASIHAYVDGFALYKSLLQYKYPQYKWLDLIALTKRLFPQRDVTSVKYFTA